MPTTRFKPIPKPPGERGAITEVRSAVPQVPKAEDNCCRRVLDRTSVDDHEEARRWLTFLRALGLVEETELGYVRTDRDPEPDALRTAFCERVFGVRELLKALDGVDRELTAAEATEHLRSSSTRWGRVNRRKSGDDDRFVERTERLLSWGVRLGLLERTGDGYRRVPVTHD